MVPHQPHNANLVTRAEGEGSFSIRSGWLVTWKHSEEFGIVDEAHVHAARVGRVMVHDLIAPVADGFRRHKRLPSTLLFSISLSPITAGPSGVVLMVICEIAYDRFLILLQYFLLSHLQGTFGRKLQIVPAIVVDGIEKIFQVVESHAVCGVFLLRLRGGGAWTRPPRE